jgi:hypothetical protein
VRQGPPPTDPRVERARLAARLLDSAIRIPGTSIRIGLDPLIGLVPGLGDVTGAAMSGYTVLLAARLGAPSSVVLRMVLNIGLDTLFGAVPMLGDLFDFGWKANTRNVALLDQYLDAPAPTRAASRAVVAGAVGAIVLVAAAGTALGVVVVRGILQLLF